MYEIDEKQIRLWWSVFKQNGKLVEVRLLGKSTYSGYFKNIDTLITAIKPLLDHNNFQYYGSMQAYFTLNEINEDLYSREQHDIFVKKPKSTTTDGDIIRRRMVMIDLDACRSAGVSSSDEEYEKAHLKAVSIYRYLMEHGFHEPIITSSGNGWHCYLPCDMPNDDEHNELIKRFLKSMSSMFSDEFVEVDEKVFNAARIDKLVGTWAKKGSDTEERKWRLAKIVKVPTDLSPNDESLFANIADLLPKEQPKAAPNRLSPRQGMNVPFDLKSWLTEHNIEFKEVVNGNSTKYMLRHCPWEDTHSSVKEYESALFVNADGQITFSCFHSHCKDKTWFDVRQFYEPDAYTKPVYQPQQYMPRQQSYAPQKPKYSIKEELPELGKKWMSMRDIQKVDIMAIQRFKTGYYELDRKIVGLAVGEVTLLSGGNASGKSSWLNMLLLNAINQGVPSAIWSGELPAPVLKTWIQMAAAGKDNLRPSKFAQDKYFVPDNVANRIDDWTDGKLFIFNNEYGCQWEEIFHDMKILLSAGVKLFVLDNLMSMNIDLLDGDHNGKQRELILQIKDFAKKEQVHIILVAHPRKTMAFLRKNDISGSADLTNAVDNVFIIHRCNKDFFRFGAELLGQSEINRFQGYGNCVEVTKNRAFGVVDLMVGMHYEIESRRFLNSPTERIVYGWEQEPQQQTIEYPQQQDYETPMVSATQMYEYASQMPFEQASEDAPF